MKFLTVVQHTQSEYLGLLEDHLEGRQIRFGYHRPFTAGGGLPNPDVVGDGLILLGGGPWGTASEGHLVPTLEEEITLARTCLMLEKPVIGIGLGSQILAIAADGKSEPAPLSFSIGDMMRKEPDALERLPAGNGSPTSPICAIARSPPAYAKTLAVDDEGAPALFQIGANAFGFTGHPGIKAAMIEDLGHGVRGGAGRCRCQAGGAPHGQKSVSKTPLVPIMTGLVQLTKLMQD